MHRRLLTATLSEQSLLVLELFSVRQDDGEVVSDSIVGDDAWQSLQFKNGFSKFVGLVIVPHFVTINFFGWDWVFNQFHNSSEFWSILGSQSTTMVVKIHRCFTLSIFERYDPRQKELQSKLRSKVSQVKPQEVHFLAHFPHFMVVNMLCNSFCRGS